MMPPCSILRCLPYDADATDTPPCRSFLLSLMVCRGSPPPDAAFDDAPDCYAISMPPPQLLIFII